MKRTNDFDYIKILPFLDAHRPIWDQMRDELGREIAFDLAQMPRDDIIRELRLTHKWRLNRIGKLFGVTRERIRQIVNIHRTRGVSVSASPYTEQELHRVLTLACVSPDAWGSRGKISKGWLIEQLGSRKRLEKTINCNELFKFDVLMIHGLQLEDSAGVRRQLNEWQREMGFSYQEIAGLLSDRFVSIATMAVFKGTVRHGYKGEMIGAPGRGRVYHTWKKPPEIEPEDG